MSWRQAFGIGICICLFADAGIFSGSLRGGPGRELFPCICESSSRTPVPARVVARPRGGGGGVLLLTIEGCDRRPGRDPYPPAVSGAGGRINCVAGASASNATSLSHVAVPPAGVSGDCRISLYSIQSRELAEGSTLRARNLAGGARDLYDPSVAQQRVALSHEGFCR